MTDQILQTNNDVTVEALDVSAHPQFMGHEHVFKITGNDVTAFVGVHNTALGPAIGGVRYKDYTDEDAALTDVLRLSEAMTWKNAAVGLDNGGGKSVIMAQAGKPKPDQTALRVLAEGLNIINAKTPLYYGAQDMNVGEDQVDYMATISGFLVGYTSDKPEIVGGNPSPLTALGVFECLKIAAAHKLGEPDLKGVHVSLQGLGSVGIALARFLHGEGAILTACDTNDTVFQTLAAEDIHIERAALDEIYDVKADIFAPNAIGGILTDDTVRRLHAAGVKIVCGAANNQQHDQAGGAQSRQMHDLGILYCPDYIVNGGGVYWVAMVGQDAEATTAYISRQVATCFKDVLALSQENPDTDMASLARRYAEARVKNAA